MHEFVKPEDDDSDTEYDELYVDLTQAMENPGVLDVIPGSDSNPEDSDSDFDANAMTDSSDDDDSSNEENVTKRQKTENNEEGASGSGQNNDEQMDEEEEIVNRIIAETKKKRNHPPDIKTDDFVVDISFHPISDLLAVGLITGDIQIYKYSLNENQLVSTYETHTKACRDVEFSDDGDLLFSVSKDRGIVLTDVATGKMKRFYDDAHEEPIFCIKTINENLFATGDDDGNLKVWDSRNNDNSPIFSLKEVDDYISCILTNDAKRNILMTSGDGYLTSVSLGARKMQVQSEQYEEELTSMGIFRNDQKLVVGTSKGKLYTFNWGEFGYHIDSFPAFKTGINSMVSVTQRMAVFGCEDGILRAANTIPGKNLGVVGQHSMAVETMDICNTGEFIASSSHDNDIRFWNIKYFEDFENVQFQDRIKLKKEQTVNLPSSKFASSTDFFADLANPPPQHDE